MTVGGLTEAETALAAALAALALAALSALWVIVLAVRLRRIRRAQRLVVGRGESGDLVEYAVSLLARVEAVEARAATVEGSQAAAARRIDGCFQRLAVVRYDALQGAGGKQSASMALLDAVGSGVVVSAIQGRDYARIYVKHVRDGRPDLELSPEEETALKRAAEPSPGP